MLAIFRESTQRTNSLAQAKIPVDTGFARASNMASLEEMPPIRSDDSGSLSGLNVSLVIAGSKLGDTIYVGWTASYVLPLEYGHSRQAPEGFVRLATQQWPQTVAKVTAEARRRAG